MKDKRSMAENKGLSAVICVLGILILVLLSSCGKKEVKVVSQDSRVTEEAFSVAEALRTAYVEKDFASVADKCSKEGFKEFMDSIKHFDSVELEFDPRWVEIDKTKVYLNIAWKGRWVVGKDTVSERGMAVFMLEGRPLKLVKIVRGNPFEYPE
jgi:hypothetical protein